MLLLSTYGILQHHYVCNSVKLIGADFELIEVLPLPDGEDIPRTHQ
jgi:hypothetical protein